MWLTGPAAPWHVGSSQTRARTRVPCISRQILNHCATREALIFLLNSIFKQNWDHSIFYFITYFLLLLICFGYLFILKMQINIFTFNAYVNFLNIYSKNGIFEIKDILKNKLFIYISKTPARIFLLTVYHEH